MISGIDFTGKFSRSCSDVVRKGKEQTMKLLFLKETLKGLLCALLVWGVLLTLFSLISLKLEDPDKLLALFSNIALFAGALIGGRVASRDSENKLLTGLITGCAIMLPVLLVSLILSDWGAASLLRLVLTVVAAILGSVSRRSGDRAPSSGKRRKEIAKKYGAYTK